MCGSLDVLHPFGSAETGNGCITVWTSAKHEILCKTDTFKSPDTDLKCYFLGLETVNTTTTAQACEGAVM